jgi:deoxyribonuclease (pyrimidine dimer)
MTRINTCIPKALTDQHLLGEYNEIRRPVNLAVRRYEKYGKDAFKNLPKEYQLGGGHVLFFYDKLQYLHKRFDAICDEMRARGFSVNTGFDRHRIPDYLYNDWEPTHEAKIILKNRLKEKIESTKPFWRYYRKPIDNKTYFESILHV